MKSGIKHRFSAAADTYDQYADLQRYVADCLMNYIIKGDYSPSHSILEIGCVTGYLTKKMGDLYPISDLIGIDIVSSMLKKCQKGYPGGHYLVADGEYLPFNQPFDLIASNLCLQWFQNPSTSLQQIVKLGKTVMLSTFGSRSFQEWRDVCRQYDLPIRTQKFLSIDELKAILGPNYCIESQLIKKSFPSWWAFWHQIRKIGASQGADSAASSSLKNLKQVLMIEEIEVTHEIIFINNVKNSGIVKEE
jgi:malonyl-CoA O-methyltransferase